MHRHLVRIIGALWMALCGYWFATLGQGLFDLRPDRLSTLCIDVFFVVLYLAGTITGFYLVTGARWARPVMAIVALCTVTAGVTGLFGFFDRDPFSGVGIALDVFALASIGILLFTRSDVAD